VGKAEGNRRAKEMLAEVSIGNDEAEERIRAYPGKDKGLSRRTMKVVKW